MLNFFDFLIEFVQGIVGLITSTITGLAQLILLTGSVFTIPAQLTPYVFAPVAACVTAVVSIAAIKLLIGRDNA